MFHENNFNKPFQQQNCFTSWYTKVKYECVGKCEKIHFNMWDFHARGESNIQFSLSLLINCTQHVVSGAMILKIC